MAAQATFEFLSVIKLKGAGGWFWFLMQDMVLKAARSMDNEWKAMVCVLTEDKFTLLQMQLI